MSETVKIAAEIAFKQHEQGRLSRDELIDFLKQLINATALTNGHAERYGLPCGDGDDDVGDGDPAPNAGSNRE